MNREEMKLALEDIPNLSDAAVRRIAMKLRAALRASAAPEGGGREKVLRDEIFVLRECIRGVRIMANAGCFDDFYGEPWLVQCQNIDINHDPVETALSTSLSAGDK